MRSQACLSMEGGPDCDNLQKLQKLKYILHEIEEKLIPLTGTFGWIHSKMIGEDDMVTCSISGQHRIPKNNVKLHEENCCLHSQGYRESDKLFSEYAGSGSCICLTTQLIHTITKNVSSSAVENKALRCIPQTSANFDQNFTREEKLAIYDYVIANTEKKKTFSDLYKQVTERKEEKRELTVWGMAAAERNAKRRRASYRNKVPTNCKTHTQILREMIEVQMEMLKEEGLSENSNTESKNLKAGCIISKCEPYSLQEKKKFHKPSHCKINEEHGKKKNRDKQYSWNTYSSKRSRTHCRGNSDSRSRSSDQYRKSSDRQTHLYKSSHS